MAIPSPWACSRSACWRAPASACSSGTAASPWPSTRTRSTICGCSSSAEGASPASDFSASYFLPLALAAVFLAALGLAFAGAFALEAVFVIALGALALGRTAGVGLAVRLALPLAFAAGGALGATLARLAAAPLVAGALSFSNGLATI